MTVKTERTDNRIAELEAILAKAQSELIAKQDPTDEDGMATCGNCGLSWNDAAISDVTPTPGGRCPFEYYHEEASELAELKRIRGMSRIAKPGLDKTITIAGHTISRLAGTDGEYEGENKAAGTDFHIRDEDGEYIVDIFNSGIKNRDAAYIESLHCTSLHEAVTEAFRPEPSQPIARRLYLVRLLRGHRAKPENVLHGFLANALNSKAIEVYDEEEARNKAEMFHGRIVPVQIQ